MKNIQYNAHIILTNKYKKIIDFLLIFIIFIIMKEGHYAFCMNETNLPNIAEPKIPVVRGIQIMTPLQREVSEFLGAAETIQQQNAIISEQETRINELETELTNLHSTAQRNVAAVMLDRQRTLNLLRSDVSRKLIIHEADGTQTERYIILPEDLIRFKAKYVSLQKMSLLFSVSTLLLGGYYLLTQTGDASALQTASEMLTSQKEAVDSIASLKK